MKVLEPFIVVDKDEVEIVLYGLKIIASHIVTVLVVLITGLLLRSMDIAVIYLTVLFLLRRNVGGYHCKTYMGCLLTTNITFMVIAVTNRWAIQGVKEILGIFLLLYSVIKIYNAEPVMNRNRIVSRDTIQKSNKRKVKWLSVLIITAIIFHSLSRQAILNSNDYFYAISSTMMVIALSIKIKDIGGERYEEVNE